MQRKNIHIHYSEMRNDNRIFKTVSSLNKLSVFDEILVVGRKGSGLDTRQCLDKNIIIQRLGLSPDNILSKIPVIMSFIWYFHALIFLSSVRPKCLNIHSVRLVPLAVFVKIFFPKTIIIYDAHELETETNGSSGFNKFIRKCLEFIGIRFFKHTVTVSPSIQNWYKQKYNISNVSLVMNCPHRGNIKKTDYLRAKFALPKDTVIFLYQGLLVPGRGVEKLLKAVEKLPAKAVLVLLGYGSDFEKLSQEAQAHPRLFMHPAVPYAEILNITASADCGVAFMENTCLSHQFSLPNKLFEFIQAQIPVIVSPTLDQSNVVVSEKVGLVCDDFSDAALARVCQDFMALPKGHFSKGLKGAREKYCWEAQEEALFDVYRQVGLNKVPKRTPLHSTPPTRAK